MPNLLLTELLRFMSSGKQIDLSVDIQREKFEQTIRLGVKCISLSGLVLLKPVIRTMLVMRFDCRSSLFGTN